MSADYVRRYYGVGFKVGDRLAVDGRPGTLVSFPGQYLGVRFDGDRHTSRCHPTWRVSAAIDCHSCGHPFLPGSDDEGCEPCALCSECCPAACVCKEGAQLRREDRADYLLRVSKEARSW